MALRTGHQSLTVPLVPKLRLWNVLLEALASCLLEFGKRELPRLGFPIWKLGTSKDVYILARRESEQIT